MWNCYCGQQNQGNLGHCISCGDMVDYALEPSLPEHVAFGDDEVWTLSPEDAEEWNAEEWIA